MIRTGKSLDSIISDINQEFSSVVEQLKQYTDESVNEIKISLAEKADKTYVDELTAVLTQDKVNSLF